MSSRLPHETECIQGYGPDDMDPGALKELADVVAEPLSIIFEKLWMSGEVPTDWKKWKHLQPFTKKGGRRTQGTTGW